MLVKNADSWASLHTSEGGTLTDSWRFLGPVKLRALMLGERDENSLWAALCVNEERGERRAGWRRGGERGKGQGRGGVGSTKGEAGPQSPHGNCTKTPCFI